MSDSLIEKMIAKGVNINNFQEVFNFFHSIDAVETDLINLPLYTTNFTEPLSYQDSAFLKLPKFP